MEDGHNLSFLSAPPMFVIIAKVLSCNLQTSALTVKQVLSKLGNSGIVSTINRLCEYVWSELCIQSPKTFTPKVLSNFIPRLHLHGTVIIIQYQRLYQI